MAQGTKGEDMAKGNHSFTEQDIRKRFGGIVGHTVAEVDTAGILAASSASRNKGRIGGNRPEPSPGSSPPDATPSTSARAPW